MKSNAGLIAAFLLGLGLVAILFFLPSAFRGHYVFTAPVEGKTENPSEPPPPPVEHLPTPDQVKGIYMTSWTASSEKYRAPLEKLIKETELNSVVIDIKDYSGRIVFAQEDPVLISLGSEEVRVRDMREFIARLHAEGIYVIGRVAVFQDAYFVKLRPDLAVKNKAGTAVWKDHKGISWIDPGSREYWDYMVRLAKEAYNAGFDEINFDYIRYPSDGNMKDISYPFSSTTPKVVVMREFFKYLHDELVEKGSRDTGMVGENVGSQKESNLATSASGRLKISADLFGMTTTVEDDMGIGQLLENALPYFDYVSPMVYPSHYPANFIGYKDSEVYPYEVVKYAMDSAVARRGLLASTTGERLGELRPWLQDFGLRNEYGPAEVKAQIKATYDTGLDSWLLWSASNMYTRGALNLDVENR